MIGRVCSLDFLKFVRRHCVAAHELLLFYYCDSLHKYQTDDADDKYLVLVVSDAIQYHSTSLRRVLIEYNINHDHGICSPLLVFFWRATTQKYVIFRGTKQLSEVTT